MKNILKLKLKLESLGFVEAKQNQSGHIQVHFLCKYISDYYENIPLIGKIVNNSSPDWYLKAEPDNNKTVVELKHGDKTFSRMESSNPLKIIKFEYIVLQNKSKKIPVGILNSSVDIPEENILVESKLNEAISSVLSSLDSLKGHAIKPKGPLCLPLFGVFFEKDNIIKSLVPNSAAYKAGLRIGDKILTINAIETNNFYDKAENHKIVEAYKKLPVQFLRAGKIKTIDIAPADICTQWP